MYDLINAISSNEQLSRLSYPWSSDKPVQPGWYVFRSYSPDSETIVTGIVEIQYSSNVGEEGLLVIAPSLQWEDWSCVDDVDDGLWKGPLNLDTL